MNRGLFALILIALGSIIAGCGHQALEASEPTEAKSAKTAPPQKAAIQAVELLPTIGWEEAPHHIDEEVFLVGQIANTGKSGGGHRFLNFGRNRSDLTGFIHRDLVEQFPQPPETFYRGKKVKIRGTLYKYRGNPNIRIPGPQAIEVLPDNSDLEAMETVGPPVVRPVGKTFTIATLNVLNLFDDKDDPYHNDEKTSTKLRDDLELLAQSIHQIDADVLVLQEVENRGYLELFNRALLNDLGYEHVVLTEGNDRRGIDVAVLSRVPVGSVTSYRHLRFPDTSGKEMSFHRDLLHTRLKPEKGLPIDVFAVHLKSQYGGKKSDARRTGEARAIREVLDDLFSNDPKARIIICGDFNDKIESDTLQTVIGKGKTKLVSFFDDVPEKERITYNKEPYRSMIDFILASPAMAKEYEKDSYTIRPGSPAETGSDHNAVIARFRLD
ncbi:MAG: endonuclease/exonuclease/phosphatase family protein [Pirellulales bacterium]|nr:endonuclease/exonuclease/phosphatase family protein [Pirellulales bacterium]